MWGPLWPLRAQPASFEQMRSMCGCHSCALPGVSCSHAHRNHAHRCVRCVGAIHAAAHCQVCGRVPCSHACDSRPCSSMHSMCRCHSCTLPGVPCSHAILNHAHQCVRYVGAISCALPGSRCHAAMLMMQLICSSLQFPKHRRHKSSLFRHQSSLIGTFDKSVLI